METAEMRELVLLRLYEVAYGGRAQSSIDKIRQEGGWEGREFQNTVDRMTNQGLIKPYAMGGIYKISADGILEAEEKGVVPTEVRWKNELIRSQILANLAQHFEQSGRHSSINYATLAKRVEVAPDAILKDLDLLVQLGYVEHHGGGGECRITFKGLESVEEWTKRQEVADIYEETKELTAQARGRAFQRLMTRVVANQGWNQQEGTHTQHEEIDIIVYRGREYYLIECKWENKPTQARIIRELYGKLGNRVGVRGIVFSMSGFTSGAKKQAEDYAGDRMILLFGRGDIESMIYDRSDFESLLDEKYKLLVTQRQVEWK